MPSLSTTRLFKHWLKEGKPNNPVSGPALIPQMVELEPNWSVCGVLEQFPICDIVQTTQSLQISACYHFHFENCDDAICLIGYL